MKKKNLLLLALSVPLFFTACDKSDGENGGDGKAPVTLTEELTSSVNVSVTAAGENRIQQITAENGNSKAAAIKGDKILCPEGFTASAVAFPNAKAAIVSYQATDKSLYKGRLDLAELWEGGILRITSSLEVDGRINHVTTDGQNRIFVGLDTKKGPCLAVFNLKDDLSFDGTQSNMTTMRLNGKSVNCIYHSIENGVEYLYSATGGDGTATTVDSEETIITDFNKKGIKLSDFIAKSGFQKVKVVGTLLTPICYQGNTNNRGKWVDGKGTKIVSMHLSGPYGSSPLATHASIQYYPNYVQKNFGDRLGDQKIALGIQQLETKSMCRFGAYDDKLYVAAADKGLLCYMIAETLPEYDGTPLEKKVLVEAGSYLDNVYSLDFISATKMCVAKGNGGIDVLTYGNGSFVKDGYTILFSQADGVTHSANYVTVKNGLIFAAYGKSGIIAFQAEI